MTGKRFKRRKKVSGHNSFDEFAFVVQAGVRYSLCQFLGKGYALDDWRIDNPEDVSPAS